ncbi:MAG: preprotein translocase subunit YajC [Oscillospiraceae bacterium]|nr:preprotein translocase subunit YajC [Oscillospiraceae bacterium]
MTEGAATANSAAGGLLGSGGTLLIPLVLMFVVMYFMIIRPESKKKKEAEALRNSLHKGDKITTIGGIMGKIVDIKDDKIVIETGEDQVRMELQKWSVMTNNTAEKEKSKRAAEAKEAAQKAKEEKARAKAERKG